MRKLFSFFAALLFAGSMMAASITVTHNSTSTVNLTGSNQATLFSADGTALSASVWSFVGQKNDASNNVGLNKDGTIRLYATGKTSGTDGCALVVTITGGTIQSVIPNIKSGTDLSVLVGGSAVSKEGDLYPVNGTSFTLQQTGAKGSTQVQLNSITINYKMAGDVDVDATDIDLDETSLSLEQYREATLEATLTPSNATTTVVWSSSDETVATVSSGLVKAIAPGTATITAAAGEGISATCAVTVSNATVLTCAQAAAYGALVGANNEKYPGGQYVVEGYVITTNVGSGFFWIADDKAATQGTFEVYRPTNQSAIADLEAGDKVRAIGYITKYNTTYEFAAGCVFSVIADIPTPAIAASETALAFGSVEQNTETSGYGQVVLLDFDITASNLTDAVTLSVLGSPFNMIAPGYVSGLKSLTINPNAGAIDTTITVSAYTGLAGEYTGSVNISSGKDPAEFETIVLSLSITVTEPVTYSLKNCWDGGEWKWKEMTKVNSDQFKLENVVFGGQGVNWRSSEDTGDGTWIGLSDFQGDIIKELDTVNLFFTPSTATIYAQLVGEYIAPVYTWTVAGDSEAAFGTTWTPANTDNDMVEDGDIFKWEKTDLTLSAGTISFKVCRDHDWAVAYPGENYSLAISEGGIYTITITFDPSSHAVNAVATKTGDAVVIPVIRMHGDFFGVWEDTEDFVVAPDEQTASLTLHNLEVGDIQFGVKVDGAWTANGATITRYNNSTSLASGSGDMFLTVDVAGDYGFVWEYATQTLTVNFPDAPFAGCDWDNIEFFNTGLAPTDVEYDQYKVCKEGELPNVVNIQTAAWAEGNRGIYINFPTANFSTVSLPSDQYKIDGAGILLYLSAFRAIETEVTINYAGNDVVFTVYNDKVITDVELNVTVPQKGAIVASCLFPGDALFDTYLSNITLPVGANYEVNRIRFYTEEGNFVEDNSTLAPNTTYRFDVSVMPNNGYTFPLEGGMVKLDAINLIVNHDGDSYDPYSGWENCGAEIWFTTSVATGCENVDASVDAVKFIENGMIVIEKNGVRYNVIGQVVR